MTDTRIILTLVHALAVCAVVTACGGGGSSAPPPQTIGPAGGTVTSAEGASVTIPPGALSSEVAIAVTKSSTIAPALPQIPDVQPAGVFFDLTPHSTTFALPVTVSVPFDSAHVPTGARVMLIKPNAAQTGWVPVPGATISGSKISGTILNFSDPGPVFVFAPTITQQPIDQTVATGQSATFSVIATGHFGPTPLFYAWQSSTDHGMTWTAIAGATNSSYTTPSTAASDSGTLYQVKVSLQAVPWVDAFSTSAMLTVVASATTPMVSAGTHHALALKADGTVWAWGRNDFSQLGDGATANSPTPVQVSRLGGIRKVAAGHYHSLALATNGSVWEWGGTQLPVPPTLAPPSQLVPAQVAMPGHFIDIAEGDGFSTALRDDGSVWAWGANGNGQFGRGTQGVNATDATPMAVIGLANVTAISAGRSHTLALKSDGSVWAWGNNGAGQLGDGTGTTRPAPVAVAMLGIAVAIRAVDQVSFAVANNGMGTSLYSWGGGILMAGRVVSQGSVAPVVVADLQFFTNVPFDTYAVASGAGASSNTFLLYIEAGNGNDVKGFGANADGELGDGTATDANIVTQTTVTGLLDVRSIDASHASTARFAIARKGDGTVWTWGYNGDGQLGDGTTINRLVPVQVQGLNVN